MLAWGGVERPGHIPIVVDGNLFAWTKGEGRRTKDAGQRAKVGEQGSVHVSNTLGATGRTATEPHATPDQGLSKTLHTSNNKKTALRKCCEEPVCTYGTEQPSK